MKRIVFVVWVVSLLLLVRVVSAQEVLLPDPVFESQCWTNHPADPLYKWYDVAVIQQFNKLEYDAFWRDRLRGSFVKLEMQLQGPLWNYPWGNELWYLPVEPAAEESANMVQVRWKKTLLIPRSWEAIGIDAIVRIASGTTIDYSGNTICSSSSCGHVVDSGYPIQVLPGFSQFGYCRPFEDLTIHNNVPAVFREPPVNIVMQNMYVGAPPKWTILEWTESYPYPAD